MMPTRLSALGAFVATMSLALAVVRPTAARGTIKNPGDHPHYAFEAEPHLSIGYKGGVGPGFRGTFVLLDDGFISSINDSVGIGVGADWLFYGRHCDGPPTAQVCETEGDVVVPVVVQWNFFLHQNWSVFGEPGVAMHFHRGPGDDFSFQPFTIYAGGRLHFSDSVSLTLRLGAPQLFHHDNVVSIGVSFML